jgi:diguanylate cyclase (GGDEF)-like protein
LGTLLLLVAGVAAAQAGSPTPIALAASAGAIPLERQAQFWIDADGRMDVEQVEAQQEALPWSVRQPGQQHRLDGRALWVRFDAAMHGTGPWYLAVAFSGVDRSQLFYRDAQGRWVQQEAGDTRPVSAWPVPGRVPTFELSSRTDTPVRYWLRVEHHRVDFAAPMMLYHQSQLLAAREREQFLLGAYFGIATLLAVVGLANAAGYRDRNFAAYAVYLIVFTAGQAAYIGVGAQHLWERWLYWNAISTFLLPGLSAAAALWFVQVVTEPARFSRLLNLLVWVLIVGLLVAVLLDTFLPSRLALAARLGLTVAGLVLVVVLIALVWRKGDDPDIRLIALGFVPVLVMALFPLARGLNLIPNSPLTRYGLAIGAAVEMPILFYALARRGARRRESELRASALPHTDALTGLADRRTLLQRMDTTLQRARGQKQTCGLLVAQLVNHDAIAAEYGRETLDRALVVTGSHLRRLATDIDLTARVGEREFALLLDGPTTADGLVSRAQQLVASGLRQAPALPPDMTLRLHVVMATLPEPQHPDAASSLQWALAGLGGGRPESRKPIRALNF